MHHGENDRKQKAYIQQKNLNRTIIGGNFINFAEIGDFFINVVKIGGNILYASFT